MPVVGNDAREKLKGTVTFDTASMLARNALAVVLLLTDHWDRSILASPFDGSTNVEPTVNYESTSGVSGVSINSAII